MRRIALAVAAVLVILVAGAIMATRAVAMSITAPAGLAPATNETLPTEQVYWRRRHWRGWGWPLRRHHWWGWRRHSWWGFPFFGSSWYGYRHHRHHRRVHKTSRPKQESQEQKPQPETPQPEQK